MNKVLYYIVDILSCLYSRKNVYSRNVTSVVDQILSSSYLVMSNLVHLMTKH